MDPRVVKVDGSRFSIGRHRENEATYVVFPLEFGSANVELLFQRAKDEAPYPVKNLTVYKDTVAWLVSSADTAVPGRAKAELHYISGDQIAKSQIFEVVVQTALTDDTTEAPDPYKDWYADYLTKVAESKNDLSKITEIALEVDATASLVRADAKSAADSETAAANSAQDAANDRITVESLVGDAERIRHSVEVSEAEVIRLANETSLNAQRSESARDTAEAKAAEASRHEESASRDAASASDSAASASASAASAASSATSAKKYATDAANDAYATDLNAKEVYSAAQRAIAIERNAATQASNASTSANNAAFSANTAKLWYEKAEQQATRAEAAADRAEASGSASGASRTVLYFDGYRITNADNETLTYQQVWYICKNLSSIVSLIYRNYQFQPRVLDEFIEFTAVHVWENSTAAEYIRMFRSGQFEVSDMMTLASFDDLNTLWGIVNDLIERIEAL